MKKLDRLKQNPVFQFFFPTRIADNILSEMYAKVFKWTFISVFISTILIYFVFKQDGPIYDGFMQGFIRLLSIVSFKEYNYVEDLKPKGLFFSFSIFIALFFCFKYSEKIPENVWDVGFKNTAKLLLIFMLLWILYLLAQRVPLEKNEGDLVLNLIISFLLISYIHALMAINFCRVFLALFAVYGIRKTTKSPYYKKNAKISTDINGEDNEREQ